MQFISKFAKSFLVLSAMSVSGFVSADSYATPCAPACCDEPCHVAPTLGQAYNPSAYFDCGPNTCFTDNLSVRFDILWWRASSCGIALGYQESLNLGATNSNTVSPYTSVSKVSPKPHFDLGFRVGLGYVCPCDGWDAEIIYTHFHTRAKAKGFSDFNDSNTYTAFRPLWDDVENTVATQAEGRWTLNLDYLDLELGHKYYVSRCFALRPFIGLRGARINQSYAYEASANRGSTLVTAASNQFNSAVSAKNNFLGAGPRVGLDVEFDIGCNWVLFGEAAGSILYGRFENHSNELYNDFSDAAANEGVYRFNQHAPSDRASGAVTDLAIGLKWEHCFCACGGQHPVTLAVAWEHHGFYGFSGFGRVAGDVSYTTAGVTTPDSVRPTSSGRGKSGDCRGDFYTQGVTFSGTFGF